MLGEHEQVDRCPQHLVRTPVPVAAPTCKASLKLVCCFFNVKTLKDGKHVLLSQLTEIPCHVVALQETRSGHSTSITGANYFEFHSAAKNGDGGIAVLFSSMCPTGALMAKPFFGLRTTSPASLLRPACRVCAPFFRATIIAAHAPHSGQPAGIIKQWWHDLRQYVPNTPSDELYVMVDGNARLGSVVSDAVGAHAAQNECLSGACLQEFAEAFGLWAPSTFFDRLGVTDERAHEPTWTSPHGTASRIDYILLPVQLRGAAVSPWVDKSIMLPREHDDRFPVFVSVKWACHGSAPGPSWPKVPPKAESLNELQLSALHCTWHTLAVLAVPDWSVDVRAYLFDHLCTCLPLLTEAQRSRRGPFFSDFAFELVRFCRVLKRHLDFGSRDERKLRLKRVFAAWSHRPRRLRNRLGWNEVDCRAIASLCSGMLSRMCGLLKGCVQQDKASFAEQKLQAQSRTHDHKAWYRALKPLRPP